MKSVLWLGWLWVLQLGACCIISIPRAGQHQENDIFVSLLRQTPLPIWPETSYFKWKTWICKGPVAFLPFSWGKASSHIPIALNHVSPCTGQLTTGQRSHWGFTWSFAKYCRDVDRNERTPMGDSSTCSKQSIRVNTLKIGMKAEKALQTIPEFEQPSFDIIRAWFLTPGFSMQ